MEATPKQNKLIAIYGRVSTSNQENEGTIETQLSAVRQFAERNGHTIVQDYIDNGWGGDSLVRPALDQLRVDAKKKNWEAVLIYDPDRLARRGAWQEVVIEELKELEIDVLFVTIPPPKTDEDIIMYKMRGVFTEYERMKIKERFRLGKVRKAMENNIILTEASYGYNFIKKKGKRGDSDFCQGYCEINQREAQIVKNIFSWVADEGLTLHGVVRRLQAQGINPRKSKRGVWSTGTLSTLLRNKTYIGEAHYGASYAVVPINPIKNEVYKKIKKTSRRMKPESEWIKITSPKIIDADLFERTQIKLKSNFESCARNTKNEYLLSHRIWCPCGCRRTGEGPQKGKHLYYRCTDRVKSFPLAPKCLEKGINARIVDKLVWEKMTELLSSPKLMMKQVERWFNNQAKGINTLTIDVEETKKEIVKLKDQADRFAKAYGAGVITVDQLKEYIAPIKEKIALLENQVNKAMLNSQQVEHDKLPKFNDMEALAQTAQAHLKDLKFEAKQGIVRNIVDRVIGTRTELQVYGFIPIENINVFRNDRDCGITECGQIDAF